MSKFLRSNRKAKNNNCSYGNKWKTTVCNMIEDCLKENGYDFIDNQLGSNTNSGIASTFIKGANLNGNKRKIWLYLK